ESSGSSIATITPALNPQPLFRSHARQQSTAWYFKFTDPFNTIYLKFRWPLISSLIQRAHDFICAAHLFTIDLLNGVAVNDGNVLVFFSRDHAGLSQRTICGDALHFNTASDREAAKRVDDVHHGGSDQKHSQDAKEFRRAEVLSKQVDDEKKGRRPQLAD